MRRPLYYRVVGESSVFLTVHKKCLTCNSCGLVGVKSVAFGGERARQETKTK